MTIEPFDWSVVLAGSWNVAILTPSGIGELILGLPPNVALEVHVAVNRIAPIRTVHDGIIIEPAWNRLSLYPQASTRQQLGRAGELAGKALVALPRTPIEAAGINVRYRLESFPNQLLRELEAPLDGRLGDAGETLTGRGIKRVLKQDAGAVTLQMEAQSNGSGFVTVNFQLDSSKYDQLRDWVLRASEFYDRAHELIEMAGISVKSRMDATV